MFQTMPENNNFYNGNETHLIQSAASAQKNTQTQIIIIMPEKSIKIINKNSEEEKKTRHFFISYRIHLPATTVSARCNRIRTCSIKPTSVHACKLRTLLRNIAMKTLHISAC